MGLLDWLTQVSPRQRATRYVMPGMVAYYWDGDDPKEHVVKDISITGAYLCATERWFEGTIMKLSLRKVGDTTKAPCLWVRGKVVRHGADGMAIRFIVRTRDEEAELKQFIGKNANSTERGQALIEYALMVPLLLLFVVSTVNFGGLLYSWVTVANAARVGAQSAGMGAAYLSYPSTSLSAIQTLIQNETSALPHSSSTNPVVTICENNSGTITKWGGGACNASTNPPQDPEPIASGSTITYSTLAIDVTYTYTAIIPTGFKFPALNILTLAMPTTVHRRTVMRILN